MVGIFMLIFFRAIGCAAITFAVFSQPSWRHSGIWNMFIMQ
jgi:hypothetical protein